MKDNLKIEDDLGFRIWDSGFGDEDLGLGTWDLDSS